MAETRTRRNGVLIGRALGRRSLADWALRLVLVGLTLVVGFQGTRLSIAWSIAAIDPGQAHQFAPGVSGITAIYSEILSDEAAPDSRRRAAALARLALSRDQTSVRAIATLGLDADARGDVATARRLFAYAYALSRRDMRTQLWMIQDAVNRGKVDSALRQYDLTLRVTPALSKILFPILTSASTKPEIRTKLVPILAAKPLWANDFITYAVSNSSDPMSSYALLMGLQRAGVVVAPLARAVTINALLTAGHIDAAWNYYATFTPGIGRDSSHDPRFAARIATPSLLDWVAKNENGVSAEIGDGVFNFVVPPSVGGPLLQQYELLSPGVYRLTGRSSGIDQPDGSRPYWVLACKDGRELGRLVLPPSTEAAGRFSGMLSVPQNCPVQTLTFVARPSDAVSGLTGQIDYVQVARQPTKGVS